MSIENKDYCEYLRGNLNVIPMFQSTSCSEKFNLRRHHYEKIFTQVDKSEM